MNTIMITSQSVSYSHIKSCPVLLCYSYVIDTQLHLIKEGDMSPSQTPAMLIRVEAEASANDPGAIAQLTQALISQINAHGFKKVIADLKSDSSALLFQALKENLAQYDVELYLCCPQDISEPLLGFQKIFDLLPFEPLQEQIKYLLSKYPKEEINLNLPMIFECWTMPSIHHSSKAMPFSQYQSLLNDYGAQLKYDKNTMLTYFTFLENNIPKTCWLDTTQTLKDKLDLIEKTDIHGVVINLNRLREFPFEPHEIF